MFQPIKNQYVIVFFKNSYKPEGFVEEWTDKKAILRSEDGQSLLILNDLTEVLMIKIELNRQSKNEKSKEIISPKLQELSEEFQETTKRPGISDLKLRKMAELKILMNEEEKKIVRHRLSSHHVSEVRPVNYERPRFFQKPESE